MIENLQFNVAQLLRDPVGASRHAEVVADLNRLAPELGEMTGADGSVEAIISGSVRLMRTNAGVLVQGRLSAQTTLACARCLEPVPVPLTIELEEVYSPTLDISTGKSVIPEEEDRALWIDEHHILDLTEVLRQDVLIAMPLNVTCKDNCLGLCATCGKNLNEGPCDCQPEIDPRWSALAGLLNTKQ